MKYIIVGGVAGGATAAARLRRMDEHAEIVLIERGEHISYANCGLPYYIGDVITDRSRLLVQTPEGFRGRFNVDVRIHAEVVAIDAEEHVVEVRDMRTGDIYKEPYSKLILSPGAEPFRPVLPGSDTAGIFTLRNVNDSDRIKAYLKRVNATRAVVVGGGFIGLEMAENLHHAGLNVTIVELGDQLMAPLDKPMAVIVQQHVREKGVSLRLKNAVTEFAQSEDGSISVLLQDGDKLNADVVILSIGVRPDTRLAKAAGLSIGKAGGIIINEYLQTSHPDIYAVGDAVEFANPVTGRSMCTYLAGPANKQARICADNIVLGNKHVYNGSVNTAIVRVFDLTVATTGVAFKHLSAAGMPHIVSATHSGSHAGYYPGAQDMTIQLAFSPESGRILGAQIVGHEGVDKRIDVISALLQHSGTVHDLVAYEHAYAPPYSSAKDPVNIAGAVAENIIAGRHRIVHVNDIMDDENIIIIDVRTPEEYAAGSIPGAVNIPIDDLRTSIAQIPAQGRVVVFCHVGQRGYLAQRILLQHGYENVFNLSGGYKLWQSYHKENVRINSVKTI